jgi:predicted small secreted protein
MSTGNPRKGTMVLTSMVFLSGCNTWKGLGKDVERAGEKMQ